MAARHRGHGRRVVFIESPTRKLGAGVVVRGRALRLGAWRRELGRRRRPRRRRIHGAVAQRPPPSRDPRHGSVGRPGRGPSVDRCREPPGGGGRRGKRARAPRLLLRGAGARPAGGPHHLGRRTRRHRLEPHRRRSCRAGTLAHRRWPTRAHDAGRPRGRVPEDRRRCSTVLPSDTDTASRPP